MFGMFFLVLKLFLGFILVAIFAPNWPWLFYIFAAVLILAKLLSLWESMQENAAGRKRQAIIDDLNHASDFRTRSDGTPVSAQAVTAGGRPVAEVRDADLQTTGEGKEVVGELENISSHVFSAVTLRVLMRGADEEILGEEQASLHQMRPNEIWKFSVPSRWPHTEGFSLTVNVEVDV